MPCVMHMEQIRGARTDEVTSRNLLGFRVFMFFFRAGGGCLPSSISSLCTPRMQRSLLFRHRRLILFIMLNITLVGGFLAAAYRVDVAANRHGGGEQKSFMEWFNQGKLTPTGVLQSLSFGVVFGFIDAFSVWHGMTQLERYLSGGPLTRAGWGLLYGDLISATLGSAVGSMLRHLPGGERKPPIWANAIGMVVGVLLGMEAGRATTGRD